MKAPRQIFALLAGLALTLGCATSYHRVGYSGGYAERSWRPMSFG